MQLLVVHLLEMASKFLLAYKVSRDKSKSDANQNINYKVIKKGQTNSNSYIIIIPGSTSVASEVTPLPSGNKKLYLKIKIKLNSYS